MGDPKACCIVERTLQTIKRRLWVSLLVRIMKPITLSLGTIVRDTRRIKQKVFQKSPFEAHFEKLVNYGRIEILKVKRFSLTVIV